MKPTNKELYKLIEYPEPHREIKGYKFRPSMKHNSDFQR